MRGVEAGRESALMIGRGCKLSGGGRWTMRRRPRLFRGRVANNVRDRGLLPSVSRGNGSLDLSETERGAPTQRAIPYAMRFEGKVSDDSPRWKCYDSSFRLKCKIYIRSVLRFANANRSDSRIDILGRHARCPPIAKTLN